MVGPLPVSDKTSESAVTASTHDEMADVSRLQLGRRWTGPQPQVNQGSVSLLCLKFRIRQARPDTSRIYQIRNYDADPSKVDDFKAAVHATVADIVLDLLNGVRPT
jgi:hypothetical protein